MEAEKDIESLPEDDSWVFESLVNFLHGPLWKSPVSSFIEEKSVVFDPESYNEELSVEREAEFKKIHDEYKALVDFMLGSFMEDLEVTPEQVEDACRSRNCGGQPQDSQLTKAALQQLSAAEDMEAFRRLMTRKNIDLQLQSLELLVSKYGELSPSLRSSGGDEGTEADEDFLQLVLRYTQEAASLDQQEDKMHAPPPQYPPGESGGAKQAHQALSQMKSSDSGEFANVISMSLNMAPGKPALVEAVVEAENVEKLASGEATKIDLDRESDDIVQKTVEEIKSNAPAQRQILASVRRALEDDSLEQRKCVPTSLTEKTNPDTASSVTEEDIARRREYMRNQRDKLVALKKRERVRLMSDSASGGGPSRPKSAKAAAMALTTTPKATPSEKSLAARKALADRLKQELQSKT